MVDGSLGPRGHDVAVERARMEAVNARGRKAMAHGVSPALRDALAAHDGRPPKGDAPALKPFQVGLCLLAARRPLDAAEVLSTYAAGLGDAPDGTLYQALALACRGAYRDADQLLEAFAISNTEQTARSPREASADMLRFSPDAFAGEGPAPAEIDWLVPPPAADRGGAATLISVDWAYFQRLAPLIAENSRRVGAGRLVVHFVGPKDTDLAGDFARRFEVAASMQPTTPSVDPGEAISLLTTHRFDVAYTLLSSNQFERVTIADADAYLLHKYQFINELLGPSSIGVVDFVGNRPWFRFAAGLTSFSASHGGVEILGNVRKYIHYIRGLRALRWRVDQCALYAAWFHATLGDEEGPEFRNLIPELPSLIHFIEKADVSSHWERAASPNSSWNAAGRAVLAEFAERLGLAEEAVILQ